MDVRPVIDVIAAPLMVTPLNRLTDDPISDGIRYLYGAVRGPLHTAVIQAAYGQGLS